jgi:DNA-binding transcriptional regulator LsrR (DeoR family)
MPAPRDPANLLAAARLYYVEGRSQAQIAAVLGTSRSNVSRMLSDAQRLGIVEIRINDPAGRVRELERALRDGFGLSDARVARVGTARAEDVTAKVGVQAAQLLLDELKDGIRIALSWGHGLQAMVYAVTGDTRHTDVSLCQLVGGLSAISNEISGQELIRDLALRLGASYRFLHAPAIFGSVDARDALLAEPSIAEALRQARESDIAFVGIGTPSTGSSAAIIASFQLSTAEQEAFWAAGPVGDIAARYFDEEGRPVTGAVSDRVLACTLEDLGRVPNVVGIASGRHKASAVLGALRGRHIDSLVCDETLARIVLSEANLPSRTEESTHE